VHPEYGGPGGLGDPRSDFAGTLGAVGSAGLILVAPATAGALGTSRARSVY
jgi:hypothetical protein